MTVNVKETLTQKLASLERMPSIPAILQPLLHYLDQPLDRLEVQNVVDLISQDKSLAAQCLHMANSPLFGRWQPVDSVRGAVVALGMRRMRDIAMSCSVLNIMPMKQSGIDPIVFWEHSLGCALVCRHFARKIGFSKPEKAYLGGLLHDFGIIVNLWVIPNEFCAVVQLARSRHIPLHEAEMELLGLTHCDSGQMLAERWQLASDLSAVIHDHHQVDFAGTDRGLVALVSLADLLCRMNGLGYGHLEERQVNFMEERAFSVLLEECPALQTLDWARLTFELENYMVEVHRLVATLYRAP
jgi:HD-like signal output (HDOD) protein